ncbi:Mobile element protein [Streptococcus pneumoniae]|nr:Mobile element protein [Streptococcus pneumoniae]
MNSLPNHHFQNKSFYQLSFDGGHLTQYGGLIFFQELFSQLKLKERISKYLVTNDQRRYCRYSDSDILVQFLFQLLTGYGTDYACKELSADAYFPKLLEGGQLASQPTLSRFLSRTDEETVHSLRCLNLELVEFFLQFHQLNQLIVDIDSTHFTTYGKQEGVAYNAHYRAHGYHPLYAFEGKTGYCFNAQLRPGNRYCSEEADSFITPVLERFNQLLFRMDSGFATPKLYDLIEKTGQYYLIKLKKNTVLSRLGDLSLPCPQDEDLTILPHSAYSETLYQAGSWSHKRRVCQFSERKEGNLFYDVISLVTNMTSGTSQDQFQLYRGRGQAENFIKEMKEGFFGDKTDSSTLIKNEVRMMMSCIAYNLYLFLKHLAGGYGTDYACKELSADAYFPKLLEGGQLASQPTLSRFLSRTDEETVHSLRCLNLELVEFFLQFHQLNQLIVDIDSTHFTTYGKQEGVAYNAHYRAHGYHPLYAFEGKTGYCFNAQLRPGNRYCSEEADSFITPVLERFNQLLFRMDSGFATPKLYDLIEKTGQCYLCPQDEDLTILPHSAYSETLYQAGSWSHKRRVCQFSERKEGNLFYDVISLVTNMTSGTSQDQFQLYRGRGQAENFIKEMKEGFFGDKTDSSTLIKNEVRMMMSCIAYNLYLFLKHLAGGDFQTLTIKRFRHLFLHVVGKCVRTGRKQLLKLSSLYAYSELFSALYSRIRKVNLNLPVPYEPPRRKASLMMH